jgi:hypothetical protein
MMKLPIVALPALGLLFVALTQPAYSNVQTLDSPPIPKFTAPPVYQYHAGFKQPKGIVYAELMIGKDGKVIDTQIFSASSDDFVEVVKLATSRWTFRPASRYNAPTEEAVGYVFLFHPIEGIEVKGPLPIP